MILIGTDDGIYRWFDGCGWPIFHSLQGRVIVSLASPGAGLIAAIDRDGTVLESVNNGMDWQVVPGPTRGRDAHAHDARRLGRARDDRPGDKTARPLPPHHRSPPAPVHGNASPDRWARPGSARRGALPKGRPHCSHPADRPAPHARSPSGPRWAPPSVPGARPPPGALVRALADGGGTPSPWFAAIRGAGLWRSLNEGTHLGAMPRPARRRGRRPDRPHPTGSRHRRNRRGLPLQYRQRPDLGRPQHRPGKRPPRRRDRGQARQPRHPPRRRGPRAPDAAGAAHVEGLQFALYESTNGGKTWAQVKRGFPEDIQHDVITDIRYDPVAPENVIVALGSGELWLSRFDRAYWCPLARQTKAARVLCATS